MFSDLARIREKYDEKGSKYNHKAYCHTKQYMHIGKTCKTYLFKSENTMQETQEKENIKQYPSFTALHALYATLQPVSRIKAL